MNRVLDDQSFLAEVSVLIGQRLSSGAPSGAEEFVAQRPHLSAQILETARISERIAARPATLPEIDGYRIERELGRGAMGTVYLARQLSLGGRLVALKVLHAPFARSPSLWARFLLEVNTLARLRHPNVVAVHDVVEQGDVLAYAMDWVEGCTLARVITHLNGCASRHDGAALQACVGAPSAATPVAFFVQAGIQVARALDAAHRLRLLHRDVKPSNILVRKDGTAVLSDFGLVHAEDSTMHTRTGDFLGTPVYAAPEQLEGRPDLVDARCDVYGLGATLYHALAGRPPYPGRTAHEILLRIREGFHEPLRRVDPRLPRELETIVMKAIDPDRERRYASASALADDLERFQHDRPIVARPASAFYHFAKLVQRHKAAFSVLALLFASVTAFAFVMTLWSGRLAEQSSKILAQNGEILAASKRATEEANRARVQARKAERVSKFVQDFFSAVNPVEGGHDVKVSERLDAATERLRELEAEPEVLATVRYTLGQGYRSLGKYREAEEQLAAALGAFRALPDSLQQVAETLLALGACRQEGNDLAGAGPLLEEASSILRDLAGEDGEAYGTACKSLGVWHLAREEYREATALLEKALAILEKARGAGHPDTADVLIDLAKATDDQARAEALLRRALDARQKAHGGDDLATAYVLGSLAEQLASDGDPAEAEAFAKRALEIFVRRLGERHDRVGTTLSVLATILQRSGRAAESERCGVLATDTLRDVLGGTHPELARALYYLGSARLGRGDAPGAAAALAEAVGILRRALPRHPDLAMALDKLAAARREQGDLDTSRELLLEAFGIFKAAPQIGPEHWRTLDTLYALGKVAHAAQDHAAAVRYLTRALDVQRKTHDARNPRRIRTEVLLSGCLVELQRRDEAEPLLLDVLARFRADEAGAPLHRATIDALVTLYEASGKPEEAERYRALRR